MLHILFHTWVRCEEENSPFSQTRCKPMPTKLIWMLGLIGIEGLLVCIQIMKWGRNNGAQVAVSRRLTFYCFEWFHCIITQPGPHGEVS